MPTTNIQCLASPVTLELIKKLSSIALGVHLPNHSTVDTTLKLAELNPAHLMQLEEDITALLKANS